MEATKLLLESINLKRYEYFFKQKNIDAPNPAVLCRSISQQLHILAKYKDGLASCLFQKKPDYGWLFDKFELSFLFRSSPVDEIEELVPIFFSMMFQGDGFGERYHGLTIWSEISKDFYTFMVAASAPAATTILDYNFSSCLSRFFNQKSESEKEIDLNT